MLIRMIRGPITFILLIKMISTQLWSEQTTITASNKAASDSFGNAVSLTDNYVLVGAYFADPGAVNDAGAAYIFVRSGTAWSEQVILTASNKEVDAYFGSAVSLTDTYALVGAQKSKPGAVSGAGAAYIFSRNGSAWSEEAIITASDKAFENRFGSSVSLTDSYALVGAVFSNPGSLSQAGSVYIFARSGSTWTEQLILTASNKAASDFFGYSVSLTDSYALIGARQADPDSISNAGAAYLYTRSGTTWSGETILKASNQASGNLFGHSVFLTDDYILVGSYGNTMRTYKFTRSGTVWTESEISNTCCTDTGTISTNYKVTGSPSSSVDGISSAGLARVYIKMGN